MLQISSREFPSFIRRSSGLKKVFSYFYRVREEYKSEENKWSGRGAAYRAGEMRIRDTRHHVAAALRGHLIARAQRQFICLPRERKREDPIYADQNVFQAVCAASTVAGKAPRESEGLFPFIPARRCESRATTTVPLSAKLSLAARVMHPAKCHCALLRKWNSVARQPLGRSGPSFRSVSKIHRHPRDRLQFDIYASTTRLVISSCCRDSKLDFDVFSRS